MIGVTFSAECPYCGYVSRSELGITSQIEGDFVQCCESCARRYIIRWIMVIDTEILRCDQVSPPVRCSVDLVESWEYLPEEEEVFDEADPDDEVNA